jgi:hypothetical protein
MKRSCWLAGMPILAFVLSHWTAQLCLSQATFACSRQAARGCCDTQDDECCQYLSTYWTCQPGGTGCTNTANVSFDGVKYSGGCDDQLCGGSLSGNCNTTEDCDLDFPACKLGT